MLDFFFTFQCKFLSEASVLIQWQNLRQGLFAIPQLWLMEKHNVTAENASEDVQRAFFLFNQGPTARPDTHRIRRENVSRGFDL